jgi:hypothetical protein
MQLTWTLLTNLDNVPTEMDIVFYSLGETPSATSPVALTRQVATTVANATNVTNTGFSPGTIIVFGLPVGDTNALGATVITNNGTINLGDPTYGAILSMQSLLSGGAEFFIANSTDGAQTIIESSGITVENATGTTVFSVDTNGNTIAANGETKITYGAGSETHIINLAGSDIAFFQGATEIARIVNNGNVRAQGVFQANNAQFSQWKNSGGTYQNVVGVDGGNNLVLSAIGGHIKIFVGNIGTEVASIDTSGNMILKGTLTQNGVPN